MTRLFILALMSTTLLGGCGEAALGPPPEILDDCPEMFQQNILPQWELDIAPAEWAALDDEFRHRPEREAQGLDPTPYHPADLRYFDGWRELSVPNVRVRLKGASSWLQTLALDANPKMQFVIAFNEVDPGGRFLGVRKVVLDMPRTDQTFVRQRLALRYLRDAQVPAQCANNARLVINGTYYGLYTNLERFDKEFLQRNFGADDDGDLWEGGRIIKTNEDTFSWVRLDKLWHLADVATLDDLADLDSSLAVWAAETLAGDADGYANGRANFYIYDHPTRGFLWLPTDLDTAFDQDFLPATAPPVFAPSPGRWERDWHHYLIVMNDPAGLERYVAALADARARFDVVALQDDLDAWSAQIADAAADEPHRQFTAEAHALALTFTRDYVGARAASIDRWLACRVSGGVDGDADGFDECHDCNDADRGVHPGAVEACNLRDDDCDGRVDDVVGPATCASSAMPFDDQFRQ